MFYRKQFFQKKKPTTISNDILFILTEEYKQLICQNSHYGKRGYTIPKSIMQQDDINYIKNELSVKPEKTGVDYGLKIEEYPVYRENDKKMYIPRFYGIKRYGKPCKNELHDGYNINLKFNGELRPVQKEAFDVYAKQIANDNIGGILSLPCGFGKSLLALYILANLGKKALIIVHKGFLANQWIDYINEFLPNAKIGKIQGQIYDVENKDIVIGMLQTLYDKDFDFGHQFGLTIIDECHHIVSSQFSKALCKIVTKYTLGISATVERKDKLDKVLYMFLGDIIFNVEREKDDFVSVRGIQYSCNDDEFNEVEYDMRGNVKYSTMISKLCSYRPRTEFIIRIIEDLIEEEPENQIMILAHQRELLTQLHDLIVANNIATCGYYVGGMKQKDLQLTETKQVVIATYSMASEGLSIKSLSTLVLCSPKTDIVQSVGRILRMKHDNPRVIDIIDSHDVFQRQWGQRKKFYKSCNYRIRSIDTRSYLKSENRMCIDWDTDNTWLKIFEPNTNITNEKKVGKCLIQNDILQAFDNV